MQLQNPAVEQETSLQTKRMYYCLMAVGVLEFLFLTMESLYVYSAYYWTEHYILVPAMIFVGLALAGKLTPEAKRALGLSAVFLTWFVIAQTKHKQDGMGNHPMGTVFCVYLMAYPFAAAARDGVRQKGLKILGTAYGAASLVLVLYLALLLLDLVPGALKELVFWDGARLHTIWHPNMSACIFMISICFCISAAFRLRESRKKYLLWAVCAVEYAAMALTNCRTTLLVTAAVIGGILFLEINRKRSWKRLILGLGVMGLTVVLLFSFAGKLYDWNSDVLKDKLRREREASASVVEILPEQAPSAASAEPESPPKETEPVLVTQNPQGTLADDMRTLNGRTSIWKSCLKVLRDNPLIRLWGTEYVDIMVSYYNSFPVYHSHNSWMEVLLRLGLPGLLAALMFTAIALWNAAVLILNRDVDMSKKCVALLTLALMAAGFLEPYLFITNVYYHFVDLMFFFCTGYLAEWGRELRQGKIQA